MSSFFRTAWELGTIRPHNRKRDCNGQTLITARKWPSLTASLFHRPFICVHGVTSPQGLGLGALAGLPTSYNWRAYILRYWYHILCARDAPCRQQRALRQASAIHAAHLFPAQLNNCRRWESRADSSCFTKDPKVGRVQPTTLFGVTVQKISVGQLHGPFLEYQRLESISCNFPSLELPGLLPPYPALLHTLASALCLPLVSLHWPETLPRKQRHCSGRS